MCYEKIIGIHVILSISVVVKILLYLIAIIILFPEFASADPAAGIETQFFVDLGKYFTAPMRWDSGYWTQFGLIASGLYIASETLDDRWKDEMTNETHPYYYKGVDKIGDAWGDGRLSGPFLLGVYGYGRWTRDVRYIDASQDILQTAVYAGIMGQVLKRVFSRDRPNAADDEAGWFGSGVSFPSGHSSNAFAVSQSFLNSLDNPSITTQLLFYGLATSTALARTYDNAHWATDTIAGALLGIYTANFVTAQNKAHRNKRRFVPYIDSKTLGFNMSW